MYVPHIKNTQYIMETNTNLQINGYPPHTINFNDYKPSTNYGQQSFIVINSHNYPSASLCAMVLTKTVRYSFGVPYPASSPSPKWP